MSFDAFVVILILLGVCLFGAVAYLVIKLAMRK